MARTALTVQQLAGPYPDPLNLDTLTFVAADVANKNEFVFQGNELIIVRNTDGAATRNVILTSVKDALKRTGDITKALPLSTFAIYEARDVVGFQQADGKFYLEADHANIQFAVVRLKR